MTDCGCGHSEGTNTDCERCRLIARITELEGLVKEVANCGIEWTAARKYHYVQIPLALWELLRGGK